MCRGSKEQGLNLTRVQSEVHRAETSERPGWDSELPGLESVSVVAEVPASVESVQVSETRGQCLSRQKALECANECALRPDGCKDTVSPKSRSVQRLQVHKSRNVRRDQILAVHVRVLLWPGEGQVRVNRG